MDWGDGNAAETFDLDAVGSFDDGNGSFELTHVYTDDEDPGDDDIYTVSFKLIDDDTGEVEDSQDITVTNADPVIKNLQLPTEIDEGDSVTLSFDVTDKGEDDESTIEIDWGDGTVESFSSLGTAPYGFSAVHVYVDDDPTDTPFDPYTIKITVTDDDDGEAVVERDIQVNNVAPSDVALSGDQVVGLGEVVSVGVLSHTDPGQADTFSFEWVVTSPTGVSSSIETALPARSFTANEIGVWTVAVVVKDDDKGESESVEVSVVVPDGSIEVDAPADTDESQVFTTTFTLNIDEAPATATQLTVNWGDGPSQTVTMAAGQTTIALTHSYADDAPSPMPVDIKAITATSTAVSGIGADLINVRNVDPTLQNLQLSRAEIDEGASLRLTGGIADASPNDTFTLRVEWGDGQTTQQLNLGPGTAAFDIAHVYRDDDPTLTPFDPKQVKVTVVDDDSGQAMQTLPLTVRNVTPVITNLRLAKAQIKEGESAVVIGSFTDAGLGDSFTIEVDWGDGVFVATPLSAVGSFANGSGQFTLTRPFVDDNPSGTPQDFADIRVRVIDDDTGSAQGNLRLRIDNVAPIIGTMNLSSTLVREGETLGVSGSFSDAGLGDTFTLEVDWGNGVFLPYAFAAHGSFAGGVGSFSVSKLIEDDHPDSGTPFDDRNIRVRLGDDDTGVAVATSDVRLQNLPPVIANAALSASVIDENQLVTLNFAISDPSPRDTYTVRVDWQDGAPEERSLGAGPHSLSFQHSYLDDDPSGTPFDPKNIVITVIDDDTGSTSQALPLRVNNVAPRDLDLGGNRGAVVDTQVPFTLAFSDPGTLDTHSFLWTVVDPFNNLQATATGASPNFNLRPGVAGDWRITAKVTDDDTGFAETTVTLTVVDGGSGGANPLPEGSTVNWNLPVGGDFSGGNLVLKLNWDDGTLQRFTVNNALMALQHTYLDDRPPGQVDRFVASAQLVDTATGQDVNVGTAAVNIFFIDNVVPTPSITLRELGGGTVEFTGSFTDPGLLDTHTLRWTFSDGSAPFTGGLSLTRTFAGPVTATLSVTDDDQGVGTASLFVPNPVTGVSANRVAGSSSLSAADGLLAIQAAAIDGWRAVGADVSALASRAR